jgi:prepilin-type N-terminal cleavage/methylation domain-containing protein
VNQGGSTRRGGFTLVELLMVITILIIAAAVVIPNIGSAGDAQAMSAARILSADIEVARDMALKTQRPHTVLFSSDLQSYKVVADYAGEAYAMADAIEHPAVEARAFEVTLAERNGMSAVVVANASFGGDAYVTFNELGEPSSSGSVTVEAGGTQIRVAVAGLTGSVSTIRLTH